MKYILSYWEGGRYHYIDLSATDFKQAEIEATGILEDEHIDTYLRNEWEIQQL